MLSFGPFELDVTRRTVLKDGIPMRLTLKCIELLIAFARSPGKTLTKEQLIETAWRDTPASDATLAQHVFLLRRALGQKGRGWIATVPQVGYRFLADVAGDLPAEEAPDEYVAGAEVFRSLQTQQGLRSAIDLYTRALALQDGDPRLFARRANCWRLLAEYMYADPYACLTAAKADAAHALSCDPNDAEARTESAYVSALFDRDFSAAGRHLDVAARRDPAGPAVQHLRVALPLMRGDVASAVRSARSAGGSVTGMALYFARAYEEAKTYFQPPAVGDPGARVLLGACRLFTGDFARAIHDFRAVYREHVDVRRPSGGNVRHYALALLIFALAKSGDRVRARRAVGDLASLARQRYVSPMMRAIAHAGLGEMDVAFAFVEEAVARFDPWAAYIAVDPFLDQLRADPRFDRLVDRIAA